MLKYDKNLWSLSPKIMAFVQLLHWCSSTCILTFTITTDEHKLQLCTRNVLGPKNLLFQISSSIHKRHGEVTIFFINRPCNHGLWRHVVLLIIIDLYLKLRSIRMPVKQTSLTSFGHHLTSNKNTFNLPSRIYYSDAQGDQKPETIFWP